MGRLFSTEQTDRQIQHKKMVYIDLGSWDNESVFYMLEYMGFSTINTVGFDVAEADGTYKHCYKQPSKPNYKNNDVYTYNYLRHIACLPYNTGHGPMKNESFDEVFMIKKLMPVFHKWLKDKGCKLNIFTKSTFMLEYDFVNYIE